MSTQNIRRSASAGNNNKGRLKDSPIRVDSVTNTVKVIPASTGSTEVELVDTATVQTISNKKDEVVVYAVDGAIAVRSHTAVLTKGSAAGMTIAAPVAVTDDGIRITIVAGTSFAHITTGTNLFWAGETGGPFNKITTAAFIGSAATIVAYNGLWHVVSDQIATVGD